MIEITEMDLFEDMESIATMELRESDIRELAARHKEHPTAILLRSCKVSRKAYCVWTNNGLVAVFGVVDGPVKGSGILWLLGTEEVYQYPLAMLKNAKRYLASLAEGYDILYNLFSEKNEKVSRLLKYLGFTFHYAESQTFLDHRFKFIPFTLKVRKDIIYV